MKTVSFDAMFAYASEEDDYYLLGFADGEFDYENYIILQLAYTFDEGDLANDMDGEYFEYNDQAYGGYKRVKKALLSEQSILFTLTDFPNDIENIEVCLKDAICTPQIVDYLKIILGDKLHVQNAHTED